jgi:geranylgeranyl transferase type-1 subunit beta
MNYIFETNHELVGGFAKWPSCSPDPLHTFMGLCALSLISYQHLKPIHPALVITQEAYDHLKELHKSW